MTKDFEELFACLRHRNVKALVVGAMPSRSASDLLDIQGLE